MKVYYIPSGPKNLTTAFPTVNWDNVAQYYIEIKESCDGDSIATSNMFNLDGECCSDIMRVHFLNSLGTIDAVNFKLFLDEHEVKSEIYRVRPIYPLDKTQHAITRFNVKANDTLTLSTIDYREEDQPWLNELLHSPFALLEWTGLQGQSDSYIPVNIVDSKMATRKFEERYVYEFTIQIAKSHDRFIIRN